MRDLVTQLKANKEKEYRKLKERFEEERRKESEKYQFEYDKIRQDLALMQKRLGQEETLNKELTILNNRL